jgi:hypothetical protein
LFIYYSGIGVDGVCGPGVPESYVFDDIYIVNYLSELDLVSIIGPNFSNHSAALHQPICDTYAAKTTGGITYVSCSISKSVFTLFFSCYLVSGSGYLVYFSSSNYVYVNSDGSLVAKINGIEYSVGSKLYFNVCSTFSITCDGSNVYIVINGLTKLVIKQTFSITEIRLGGNGSSGYSVECYFFDLFLLPSKLPLYSYYLHNTIYDGSNFFREIGYDDAVTNGYLTCWPEVIFSGDEVIFRSNIDMSAGWKYYRPITIVNSGSSALSDYKVKVELSVDDLGNPYNNIKTDGSDIRFILTSGLALLPYWIESWDNTGDSYIWVNVSGTDSIPIGESNIRMYYGNLVASSDSNGYNVFEFFDSFETYSGYSECERCYNSTMCGSSYYSDFLDGIPVLHAVGTYGGNTSRYAYKGFNCIPSSKLEITLNELQGPHVPYNNEDVGIYYYLYDHDPNVDVDFGPHYSNSHFTNTTNYMTGSTGDYFVNNNKKSYWVNILTAFLVYVVLRLYDGSNIRQRNAYVDYIYVRQLADMEPILTVGDEVELDYTLVDIPSNIIIVNTTYSVSFNNGGSWYVSDLYYEDIFTKYFGFLGEFDTILRLTSSSGTIDKDYIIKVNDFNQFDVNYLVDFTAGTTRNGYEDTETDFIVALPALSGTEATPVEYAYETSVSGLKSTYFDRPVEYSWGGTLGSGVISKDVEYCFDIVMDSWADDTKIDFWLGELYQGYYRNYYTYFTLSSGWFSHVDLDVDFVLANWKYFPTQTDIICSVVGYNDQETEINIGKGRLISFLSDIKASNMVYGDFSSSMFCSLSGSFPDCFSEVQVISGSIGSYESNIYCSLLDISSNFGTEIKLNTVVIENFNIDNTIITGTDFCFSVDVYDMYYGITTSGIQVYMNTTTISGNEVTNKTFLTISGGYTTFWCYDVGGLSPLEYVEIIVKGTNEYGDLNIVSYFLKYGKRYYYNLYHITKHGYETLIPMLMVAENNVDIFPSFSTESMYVITENYKRKSLGASIFGVSLDRGDLQAEVVALTNNFYNGGYYKVRVECNDLSGNVMNPLEFEFTIRPDGL